MSEATPYGTLPSVESSVSRPSPLSVEETLARLKGSIASRNLTLFAQIDHPERSLRHSAGAGGQSGRR